MPAKRTNRLVGATTILLVVLGCKEAEKPAKEGPAIATAAVAAPPPKEASAEPPPAGCKATGEKPVELGSSKGSIFGFVGDATSLYFASWHELGNRGDLGKIRKDGGGTTALTSLQLEARALAVDDKDVFFSEGIRLAKLPKEGGKSSVLAPKFSSQRIALDTTHVYGVPGDYGPYDRLVKMQKTGGVNYEIDVATRPEVKLGPVGYSAIAVDANGVYVTDSGNHRVLRFSLERGKPKVLAAGQPKAFDLATDSENVYFTLAEKGHLMVVSKTGGAVKKLASGLVPKSRIAADESGIVASFAGEGADAPTEIALLPRDGGARRKLATVPSSHSVEAVTEDSACVYWAARAAGSGNVTFYAVAR